MAKGRKSANLTPIKFPANFGFHGIPRKYDGDITYSNLYQKDKNGKVILDENGEPKFNDEVQKNLKDLAEPLFVIKDPDDPEDFGFEIPVMDFGRNRRKSREERLVYEVKYDPRTKKRHLQTGLYIGLLKINDIRIDINTGYNDVLLQRMLNVAANDIYLDNSVNENSRKTNSESTLSYILAYMFLTSFKAAFAMGIPTEYQTIKERGFNVRGKLDINRYIQKDMYSDGKLSYSFRQREYVQDIIDVLYRTMSVLEKSHGFSTEQTKFCRQLKELRSGKRVSPETIRRIEKHRSLNNPMYSRYKRTLFYARLILEQKDIIQDDDSDSKNYQGFLADLSQLWEVYLEKILRDRLEGRYVVEAQERLELYKEAFYARSNYPDIVIKKPEGTVVAVIDAKFKTMKYREEDVDRGDLFQIHSYSGYYNEKFSDTPLKFCSLVYPARENPPENVETDAWLYGLKSSETSTKFSVGFIRIGEDFTFERLIKEEDKFLKKIEALLEIPESE